MLAFRVVNTHLATSSPLQSSPMFGLIGEWVELCSGAQNITVSVASNSRLQHGYFQFYMWGLNPLPVLYNLYYTSLHCFVSLILRGWSVDNSTWERDTSLLGTCILINWHKTPARSWSGVQELFSMMLTKKIIFLFLSPWFVTGSFPILHLIGEQHCTICSPSN